MNSPVGQWVYKVRKCGKNNGEKIVFVFQGRDFMETVWYPPWQNDLQRHNARIIVDDLNAALQDRLA